MIFLYFVKLFRSYLKPNLFLAGISFIEFEWPTLNPDTKDSGL